MFFRSKGDKAEAQTPAVAKPAAVTPVAPMPAHGAAAQPIAATPAAASAYTMPSMSASPAPAADPPSARPVQTAPARKDPSVAFSQAVGILMRAPQTRDLKIADMEWLLLPALRNQQIAIAEAKLKSGAATAPVAVLLWAEVSSDVERKLIADPSAIPRLEPAEWKSGTIPWIVAALGPAEVLKTMVVQLVEGPLGGRRVRGRVADPNGTISVQELG